MQLAIGLICAVILSLIALTLRLIRRRHFDLDEFAQDVLISFGVGVAVALIIVPAVGISWAFIHNHSQLTLAMVTVYDQNGLMFSLIVGAAASAYLALKAYIDRVSMKATHQDHPAHPEHPEQTAQRAPVEETHEREDSVPPIPPQIDVTD